MFWNPLSFYLLFSETPVISMKLIWAMYVAIFFIGIILIWLINKNIVKNKSKDIILSFTFLGILYGVIISLNFGITEDSIESDKTISEQGVVFPKNYTVRSKTIEYDYKIVTNSLGIRDKEISLDKGGKYRILCFGDSWTMGFGVNIEYSWPRKLQGYFVDNGYDKVEVINCGRGGEYTTKYLEYMNKAIPLLKPDLVLVGVLQLDDLAQLYENNNPSNKVDSSPKISLKDKIIYTIKTYGKYSIGNIYKRLAKSDKSIDLTNSNIESVKNKLGQYDYSQKKQYELLPDSVQYMFESGNLNPGLLNFYVSLTYRTDVFNNPKHSATKFAINMMDKDIKNMKFLCNQNNAELVFVNMPTARFTGHKVVSTPADVFNIYYEKNNHLDSIYQSIAIQNKLPYIELTNHFIELFPKDKYYYKFDGHPNKNGYAEIAEYIGTELLKLKIIK